MPDWFPVPVFLLFFLFIVLPTCLSVLPRLKQWWRQRKRHLSTKPTHFYEFGGDDDQQWITIAFERGQCADCGDSQFIEGPSGGMSTNIQCYQCGQAWNHSVLIVTRNPWNQFGWPSMICTRCSGSGDVSGDMHGQHYHCRVCYGHGYILLHEPHMPPSGGSNAQPPVRVNPHPSITKPSAPPMVSKPPRKARRKIRLRKEQP